MIDAIIELEHRGQIAEAQARTIVNNMSNYWSNYTAVQRSGLHSDAMKLEVLGLQLLAAKLECWNVLYTDTRINPPIKRCDTEFEMFVMNDG